MNFASVVWIILFTVGLIFEAYTIVDQRNNTTLSRHVWWLRGSKLGRPLLVGSFSWLTYHFFFEDPTAAQTFVDDWAVVVAPVLALYVRPERREKSR